MSHSFLSNRCCRPLAAVLPWILLALPAPAQADLIGLYSFDNEASPLTDDSGGGNTLTSAGADPTLMPAGGFEGGAYDFDGAQRLIAPIDINASVLPQATLGAWVKTSTLDPGLRKIMGHDNGGWDRTIGLDNREDGVFRYTAFVGNGPPVAGTPEPQSTDDWTFIAATFDQPGNEVIVYVDLDASTTGDAPVATSAFADHNAGFATFSIGSLRPDSAAEGWTGLIDNVFVFDEVLSAAQIAAIRDGGKSRLLTPFPQSPPSEALIGFYSFDDGGDPFADASPSGSHLTSAGADPAYEAAGGFQGGGYTFDGQQRLVSPIDISPGILPQLTVGAWVRPSTIEPGLRKILGHDDGGWDRTIGLDNRDTNVFRYTTFVGNGPPLPGTPGPVNTTDWTFIAAAYDQPNNTVTLYIDLDASSTGDSFFITSAATGYGAGFDTLTIGNLRPDNNSEGWQGSIDNVFLYNTLLSPGQIAAIRDGGAAAILAVDDPNLEVNTATPLGLLGQNPGSTAFNIPVANGGATETLVLSNPVLGGPDAAHYSITSFPAQLTPGATGNIEGVFDPEDTTGAFVATLTLRSTDPNDPLIVVDLSANVPRGIDGLFAFYSFDNPADPFRDDSLSGNSLQSAGADPVYNASGGIEGGAYAFNGTQRLVAPININPGVVPELTLGAWVRTSTLDPGLRKVIGHDDGGWDRTIGLDDRDNGVFRYTAFIGNGPPAQGPPGPVSTEDWTFLAVAYDQPNNEVSIYVDNELVSAELLTGVAVPTAMGNGNTAVAIGGISPVNANEGWQGEIDNVFFVSRILSAQELSDIRTLGRDGILLPDRIPTERLIGFYPFDDDANPLADASAAGNDLLDGLDGGAANPVWNGDSGFRGGAFSFNGSQRLEMPVDINPDVIPELTMGAWVKPSSLTSGLRKIMGHDDGGWDRTIGLDNRETTFRYSAFTGTHPLIGTPGPTSTEDWTFIAAVYDNPANEVTLYLDLDATTLGDSLVSVTEPTMMGSGLTSVAIGSLRPDNANEGWEGLIDNAFFFDTALTLEELTLIRNSGTPFPSEGDDPDLRVTAVPDLSALGTLPPVHDLSVAIRNDGNSQTLAVASVSVIGEDAAFFEVLTPTLNLAPAANGQIDLRFDPRGQSGVFRAQLLIESNDPSEPATTLGLNANVLTSASLAGLYPFDEATPLNDFSGLGNHLLDGQDGGAADPVHEPGDGFEGGSFAFDGLQRLVAPIDVNPNVMPQLTLGAWVRTGSINTGLRKVMGHDDGGWDRTIGLDNRQPDGDFRYTAFIGNGPPLAGTPGPANTTDWTFLAAVYDNPANTVTVYVDLDASTTADDPLAVTSATGMGAGLTHFSIGSLRPDNNSEGWVGNIDNAFLIRGALDFTSMRALRDGGLTALQSLAADPVLTAPSESPFGNLGPAPGSVTRMIPIANSGAAQTLEITRVSLTGPDAALYTVGAFPTSLAPGAAGSIEVAFDSLGDSGSFFAAAEIISNDSAGRRRNVSLAANVQPSNLADVLIGYYTFDNPDDPLQDDSENGAVLTAPDGAEPVYVADGGLEGGAFEFTGGTRLITPIDINTDVYPALTFGAWVKTSSLDSGLRKVIGHDNGAWDRVIGLDNRSLAAGGALPDGTLRYAVFPGDNGNGPTQGDPAPEPVSIDDWTFLAAVYDDPGQTVTLYVDLDVSTTDDALLTVVTPTAMGRGQTTTAIGSLRPDNANEGWIGFIDNVFFFETLLSEEDLTEMRDFGGLPPSDDPNLRLPRGLVFGNLGPNPGNTSRDIVASNTGPAQALAITRVGVTGPDAGAYSVVSFPPTIPASSTGVIEIRLSPGNRTGGFVAFLEIESNDVSDPLQILDLSARIETGNGLIAHHRLDETEGEMMLDSSGNARHGRYRTNNGGSFTLGQSALADGFAVALDDGGSGDDSSAGYGDVPSASLPELTNFSAALWINQDAGDPGVSALFAKGRTAGDPFALVTTAGSLIWFSGGTQGLQLEGAITPGTAQHVVAVYEDGGASGTVTIYIDGVEVANQPGVAPVDDSGSTPLQIGAINGAFGFTGIVDDFQLYSMALSAEDVTYLFENPAGELPGGQPPVGVDTDGDGVSDAAEAVAGTDPNDPSDYLRVEAATRTAGGFEFSWQSKAGKTYDIDYSTSLQANDWSVIGSVDGADGVSTFTDSDAGRLANPEGHYRARVRQ